MWTKNGIIINSGCMLFGSKTSQTLPVTIKDTNGNSQSIVYAYGSCGLSCNFLSTGAIYLATVDNEPEYTEYALKDTDIKLTQAADTVQYLYDNTSKCTYVYHTISGQYSGTEDKTLYSVKRVVSTSNSYYSSGDYNVLVYHEKFNQPIAVKPGDHVTFTIKFTLTF